jgi:hypothetical protein
VRKVTIIPTGAGNGQEVVIYDETKSPLPDACADGFVPQTTRLIRPVPGVRAGYQPTFDRQNSLVRWTFTVLHTFDSYEDCQDFVGQRADVLPGSGELLINLVSSEGATIRAYKTCFIESHGPVSDVGVSVRYRYQLVLNSSYSITP